METRGRTESTLQALTANCANPGQRKRMEASGKEKKWSRWRDRKK